MFKAKKYDKIYNNRKGEIEFLLKHLKGRTILDIGGGTGAISEELNKNGFDCAVLEPQNEMADIAKDKGIKTLVSPIENVEITTKTIKWDNAIMVFDVFNFLSDPEKAIKNISQLLKGRLIFTYWNYDVRKSGWDFNWKLKRLSHKRWKGDEVTIDFWFPFYHEQHKMKVYAQGYILKLLLKNGFKVVEKIKDTYITKIVAEI
jgi:SAM-dependent methyltransferase